MSEPITHPPIGSSFHREFRDLDTRRLPSAPPRMGAAVPPNEKHMTKTQAIIDHLKANATTQETALKPAQIGTALGGESKGFDTNTVSALLRFATKVEANARLQWEKRGVSNYWWWGHPVEAVATKEPTAETAPQPEPEQPAEKQVADAVVSAIDELPVRTAIKDAEIHARRLRALARHPLMQDALLSAWLRELAALVEGGGA